jgi:hypothetical protein
VFRKHKNINRINQCPRSSESAVSSGGHSQETQSRNGRAGGDRRQGNGGSCRSAFPSVSAEADLNIERYLAEFPERQDKPPGLGMVCLDCEHYFARLLPGQAAGLEMALRNFPADVIAVDSLFFGTVPMLLEPREKRPAIVHLSISVLNIGSGKNVPARPGVPQKDLDAERERRERLLLKPVQAVFNTTLTKIGSSPLPCPVFESMSTLPDLYLHPGIRSFEYPDESSTSPVQFIGPPPLRKQYVLPNWWHELYQTKRLVLITQGTIANRDLGQLVGPALVGFAEETDLILLVTNRRTADRIHPRTNSLERSRREIPSL